MKKYIISSFLVTIGLYGHGQTQVDNPGFETWDNLGSNTEEPVEWNGTKTGGGWASSGPQTCWRESSNPHSGSYCARIVTGSYFGSTVNGSITVGKIQAPTTNANDGYSETQTGGERFPCTVRPDSIVFWARYTSVSGDMARAQAILHENYSQRTPFSNDPNGTVNVIANAELNFTGSTNTWVRKSIPFNYATYNNSDPAAYMLITFTSSYVPGSGGTGSTLWVDDVQLIYNPPVTGFTASNLTVCAGQTVNFTNTTTSGTAVTYAWNFGDGGTSTLANPSHTYTAPGVYNVQLTATNAGGPSVQSVTITVNATPSVSITGPTTVCSGSSITLTANGASTYLWGGGLGAGASQTVSPASQTTYTVTGSQNGCTGNASIVVNVDTPSAPGTPVAMSACVALTSLDLFGGLTGEDPGGTWNDDNNTGALSGSIFNPSMVSAGSYNFTYTQPATGACPSTSATVTVQVTSSVSAGSPSGNNSVCANDNAFDLFNTITGYSSGGIWNDDNATGALSGNLFDATSVAPGTYSFTYNFAPGACGTDTETISIIVSTPPAITASNDDEICIGESATISATGGLLFDWDNGLGIGSSHTVSPTVTTTYTVLGVDGNGCTNMDQVTIVVHELPNVSAGPDQSVCEGSEAVLYGSGAFSYSWTNGVSNGISFTPPSGTTSYTVTGSNQYGCENTDDVNITVVPLPNVTIDNFTVSSLCTYSAPVALPAGTPAGGYYSGAGVSGNNFDPALVLPAIHTISYVYTDANGCTNYASTDIEVSLCLGLEENGAFTFQMMPNPAGSSFTIELGSLEGKVIITDASGRIVQEIPHAVSSVKVDCANWQNGVYFVEWISSDFAQKSIQKLQILH